MLESNDTESDYRGNANSLKIKSKTINEPPSGHDQTTWSYWSSVEEHPAPSPFAIHIFYFVAIVMPTFVMKVIRQIYVYLEYLLMIEKDILWRHAFRGEYGSATMQAGYIYDDVSLIEQIFKNDLKFTKQEENGRQISKGQQQLRLTDTQQLSKMRVVSLPPCDVIDSKKKGQQLQLTNNQKKLMITILSLLDFVNWGKKGQKLLLIINQQKPLIVHLPSFDFINWGKKGQQLQLLVMIQQLYNFVNWSWQGGQLKLTDKDNRNKPVVVNLPTSDYINWNKRDQLQLTNIQYRLVLTVIHQLCDYMNWNKRGRQLQLSDNCYKPQVNPLLIKWNAKEQKLQQLITVVTQFQYSVNWSRKGQQFQLTDNQHKSCDWTIDTTRCKTEQTNVYLLCNPMRGGLHSSNDYDNDHRKPLPFLSILGGDSEIELNDIPNNEDNEEVTCHIKSTKQEPEQESGKLNSRVIADEIPHIITDNSGSPVKKQERPADIIDGSSHHIPNEQRVTSSDPQLVTCKTPLPEVYQTKNKDEKYMYDVIPHQEVQVHEKGTLDNETKIKKNEFSLINETHHDPDIHSYSYMNVLTPQNTAPALLTTENNGVWLTSSTIMTVWLWPNR